MVSGDDDASAVRRSSSGSCLSSSDLLTNRRASCHGSKAPSERPPLVVDHGLSFWTTRSRRPLTVGLYRSRRRLRTVVLTNVADDPVRWRWRTAGSTWSSNEPVTMPLIVDDYDRKQKASTLTSTLLTHCRWVTMVDGGSDWWGSPPTLAIAKY